MGEGAWMMKKAPPIRIWFVRVQREFLIIPAHESLFLFADLKSA